MRKGRLKVSLDFIKTLCVGEGTSGPQPPIFKMWKLDEV